LNASLVSRAFVEATRAMSDWRAVNWCVTLAESSVSVSAVGKRPDVSVWPPSTPAGSTRLICATVVGSMSDAAWSWVCSCSPAA
jgi:hypothetical protein